jgi:hypothetical protein
MVVGVMVVGRRGVEEEQADDGCVADLEADF